MILLKAIGRLTLLLPAKLSGLAMPLWISVVYTLMLAPVVILAVISVFDQQIVSFPPEGWTWRWYLNAWDHPEFATGLLISLQVAVLSTLIGVPLGTAAALALVRSKLLGKSFFNYLLLGPLVVPGVVAGAALYLAYVRWENLLDMDITATLGGLVAGHTLLAMPWTVRLVVASLEGMDRSAEEAAVNLGARPWTVFRRVTLPMMRSGVIAAMLFAFIQSFENLDLSLLLVGPGSSTLPVAMLSYLEFRIDPTLAAVATVQVVVIGVLMVVTDRFVKLSRIV
ncbi:MAG: ABC transporter permease [Candidimonas sp.]